MASETPKYELVAGDTIVVLSDTAHRIRAVRDIPAHGVRAGDLGGYVQSDANLSHKGDAWISGDAMAIHRSRVEDGALATDCALLSDHAVLRGHACMFRSARADGHALIQGQARMTDIASAHDTVMLTGDTSIDQGYSLTGSSSYQNRADGPVVFLHSDPTSGAYGEHLSEALAIDPALHRVFAVLRVKTPANRSTALLALQRHPEGRSALTAIVRAVGGTFHPDTYYALNARTMIAHAAAGVVQLSYKWSFEGFRYFTSIGTEPFDDLATGDSCFCGVVRADRGPNAATLYQAAILRDYTPDDVLTPTAMEIRILPGAFPSLLDAQAAATAELIDLSGDVETQPSMAFKGNAMSVDMSDLPVLIEAVATPELCRFTVLQSSANGRGQSKYMELHADRDFGTVCDFKELTADLGQHWQQSKFLATNNPIMLAIKLPPPSGELAGAIARAVSFQPREGQIIMKRDMDLVRSILLEIEANQQINGQFVVTDADIGGNMDADRTAIQYHLRLLMDAGYVEGQDLVANTKGAGPDTGDTMNILRESGTQISIDRMSWEGHDFLDSVRDNKVWSKTKGYLKDVGGVGVGVLKDVATAVIRDQIRQHTGLGLD